MPVPVLPAETPYERRVHGNGFSVLSNLVAQAELRRRETAVTGASATSPKLRIEPSSLCRELPLHVLQSAAASAVDAGLGRGSPPSKPGTLSPIWRAPAAHFKGSAEARPCKGAEWPAPVQEGPVSCVAHPYLRSVYFGDPCLLEPPSDGPGAPWILPVDQRGKEAEAEEFAARAPTLEQRHRLRQLALSEMKASMEEQMKRVAMGLQSEQPLIVSLKAAALNGSLADSHASPAARGVKKVMRRVRGDAELLLERTLGEVGQLAVREMSRGEEEARVSERASPRARLKAGVRRVVMANAMSVHDASDKTPVALVLSPVSRRRGSVSDGHVSYPSSRPARRRDAAAATDGDKGGGGGDAAPLAGGGSSGRGTPGRLHSDGRLPPVYEEFRGGGTCATAATATGGGVGGQGGEPVRAESPSHVQLPALCPRKASRFRMRPPGEAEAAHERPDDWRPNHTPFSL